MPAAATDLARSPIEPSSILLRGWSGLGRISSIGMSRSSGTTASEGDSGRIAASPRPMPRLLATLGHLAGERHVRLGARRAGRVLSQRKAVARSLGDADAAGDHGP